MATVSKAVQDLWEDTHVRFSTVPYPNLSDETEAVRHRHADALDAALRHDRDMEFTLFGFKTLMQSYLTKDCNGHVIERPQHLWMRVAVGIHGDDLEAILACYEMLSTRRATHATPTLFNAGTIVPQMSSCFLLALKDDSIDGIFRTVHDCAMISKSAGGIGVHVHNVRASGAYIHGTNGTSNGIVPMVRPVLLLQQRLCVFAFSPELTHFCTDRGVQLRVFNNTARYVDQGGGRRKGSFAIWLEPWHLDVVDFLQLRKNTGAEEDRARGECFLPGPQPRAP